MKFFNVLLVGIALSASTTAFAKTEGLVLKAIQEFHNAPELRLDTDLTGLDDAQTYVVLAAQKVLVTNSSNLNMSKVWGALAHTQCVARSRGENKSVSGLSARCIAKAIDAGLSN